MSYPFNQLNEARGNPPDGQQSEDSGTTSCGGGVIDTSFWSQALEIVLFPFPGVGQSLGRLGLTIAYIIWCGIPLGLLALGIYLYPERLKEIFY